MKLPVNDVAALIEVLVRCVAENDYQVVKLQTVSNRFGISSSETECVIGFLIELAKRLMNWSSHSEVELKQNLHEMGFRDDWVSAIHAAVGKNENRMVSGYMPRISLLVWRVDISLCYSNLKRVMSPIVLWNVTLTTGRKHTIEMSIKKYHELRFNIASILKEMFVLNNNSLVKK